MKLTLTFLVGLLSLLLCRELLADERESQTKLDLTMKVLTPASYDKNTEQKYPVVYLFDSSPFYLGDYFAEAKLAIERLAVQHSFPEVVIVNIRIESLYRTVNAQRQDLFTWFQTELQPKIADDYRTLDKQVAVGFSYTGGWVAAELGLKATNLTAVLSLSPVFDNTDYFKKPDQLLQSLPQLYTYYGDEHRRLETAFLSIWADKKLSGKLEMTQLPSETHQSSFIPSLRHGLLAAFSDYRSMAFKDMSASNWTTADVEQFFQLREQRYGIKAAEAEQSDVYTSFAEAFTYAGKLEQAKEHWSKSTSQYKAYFISQIASEVELAGNAALAAQIKEQFKDIL